ncbi:MAG: substrate-binding domain-containing protein [Rhodobacteraceae bacterium]|nr:substrate-binding domain-containing protein [Paracoccaceae bacterium]
MTQPIATSREVAERVGVSRSAVSRVFTQGASVSPQMAERVRKAASELGYRPNALARSLITGNSRIIGLVVAYLDNFFYPQAIKALSHQLKQRGYHVLMFMAPKTAGDVDDVLREILDYQVDGLILASVAMSSDLTEQCRQAGIPVVLFNRTQPGANVTSVTSDNVAGGKQVARLLAETGHRNVAYVAGWEGASTQQDREAGFRAGLAQAGLTLNGRAVGNFETEAARQAARDLMSAPGNRRDAIFVANDHMAFAVMDVLRFELGLRIPEDLSVIGFDDVPMAAWPTYDLTTVRQPTDQMSIATADTLLTQIKDPIAAPTRIELACELIRRGSLRAR